MADLAVVDVTDAKVVTSDLASAGASGDRWKNDDRTFLLVETTANPRTVTIAKQRDEAFLPGKGDVLLANIAETTTGNNWIIMRAPRLGYTDPLNGFASVSYDDETMINVAAIRQSRKR